MDLSLPDTGKQDFPRPGRIQIIKSISCVYYVGKMVSALSGEFPKDYVTEDFLQLYGGNCVTIVTRSWDPNVAFLLSFLYRFPKRITMNVQLKLWYLSNKTYHAGKLHPVFFKTW